MAVNNDGGRRSGDVTCPRHEDFVKLEDERFAAQQETNRLLFNKVDSISRQLWLIIGGITLANVLLILGAAYMGGHAH